jgi:hypothetical protein
VYSCCSPAQLGGTGILTDTFDWLASSLELGQCALLVRLQKNKTFTTTVSRRSDTANAAKR